MFKKLFVSLIILSTLTTEGIAAYSTSLAMFIYPSGFFGAVAGEGALPDDNEDSRRSKAALSQGLSVSMKDLTLNIDGSGFGNDTFGITPLNYYCYPNYAFTFIHLDSETGIDRYSAFQKSGLSPPFVPFFC